ncbi:MAG: hypothetical protein QGI68_17180 [Pseudomonadales bacterium]|nr:hypothetical protein [Pseudomonadales bacterium]MDP7597277.1 hypothetical protein [Pseudomonadales bacterium]HJN49770.1 hypothetical protein [Pseudomonadales bacterium]
MTELTLTDQERAAFHREITRNLALDYFFVFDNVPLHFIYRDRVIPGDLTDLEARNKAITETVWTQAYHQYLVCNVAYLFLYRGSVLQMPLQVHQLGDGMFAPPAEDNSRVKADAVGVQVNFDAWMESTGWAFVAKSRNSPPKASWQTVVSLPDRTMRIASLIPVGNQVLVELIVTWSEDGVLKETAFVAVLIYDVDGTVLLDRSYIEMSNWPSGRRYTQGLANAPQYRPETTGAINRFYEYQKDRRTKVEVSDLEKRNLSIVEKAWIDARNSELDRQVFHPDRFRTQWPLQKCSYNLGVSKEVEEISRQAAPDRQLRLALTYAKGNQVVAEGLACWNEDGIDKEAPFISFLMLDKDGLIIRDRCYLTMENWPGADKVVERLGL